MTESYELDKGTKPKEGCPGGMHIHQGFWECHPLDHPHRPGTGADYFHKMMGIPNTWFEKHGITREEWEKQNPDKAKTQQEKWGGKVQGEESEGGEESSEHDDTEENQGGEDSQTSEESQSDSESSDDEDYSKVDFKGFMQWDCEKELQSFFGDEEYHRIEKAQAVFDKLKDNEKKKNADVFRDSLGAYFEGIQKGVRNYDGTVRWKDMEFNMNPKVFNKIPRPLAMEFIQATIDSIRECPIASVACRNIRTLTKHDANTIMHYSWNEDGEGAGMLMNMVYFNGGSMYNEEHRVTMQEKDADGKITYREKGWRWHFDGSTYASTVQHEYGHGVDFAIGAMMKRMNEGHENNDIKDMFFKEFKERTGEDAPFHIDVTDIGQTFKYSGPHGYYEIVGKLKDAGYEPSGRYSMDGVDENIDYFNTKRLKLDTGTYNKCKDWLESWFEDNGFYYRLTDPEEDHDTVWIYVQEKYTGSLPEKDLEMIREKGLPAYISMLSQYPSGIFEQNTQRRVEECADLYKKIYKVDRIDPSEVYSGYGWSGFDSWKKSTEEYTGDEPRRKGWNPKTSACMERMAEAYQDVMVRKDRSNSMSRLLYAHTQYELLQITKGYKGTFEEFIRDKVGMDKFEERIIKNVRDNTPEWYHYLVWVDKEKHVAKGFKKGTPDRILKQFRDDTKDMEWGNTSYKGNIIRQFKKTNKPKEE